jgi:dTDP-3-amino-3,4,6-trideoxy-alpha-D-glucose transaminase
VIPSASPQLRLARFSEEIEAAVRAVLASRQLVLGERLEEFEARFAAYVGVPHCVGVNSGTDAIGLALRACGVRPGDEVITASMTAAGTGMGILMAGALPRFVEVDPVTRCLDPEAIETAIGPKAAAIVPVHLHGRMADMDRVMAVAERHGLVVVEDCAQAHGAVDGGRRAGSFGTAAAFSFYPTKNLGCAGDGGAVLTSDAEVAERLRALRSYGWEDDRRLSTAAGFNSRLDELQAAILLVMLGHLEEGNSERAEIAARYRQVLRPAAEVGALTLPAPDDGAVNHQFAIEVDERDHFRDWLRERGIGTGIHYPAGLHEQPAFADAERGELPMTERLARRFVSLPIQPEVVGDRAQWIAETVGDGVAQWTS